MAVKVKEIFPTIDLVVDNSEVFLEYSVPISEHHKGVARATIDLYAGLYNGSPSVPNADVGLAAHLMAAIGGGELLIFNEEATAVDGRVY